MDNLDKEFLALNAKLQQKKNRLRKDIAEHGYFKKGGQNAFDKYTYFSEAQYKELFNRLFSSFDLELTASVLKVEEFEGSEKMRFGRRVTVQFTLSDIETGFYEEVVAVGEGTDKGDKAIYKAKTGALKYYFADTFFPPTNDDAEKESDDGTPLYATKDDVAIIKKFYEGNEEKLKSLLIKNNITEVEKMPYTEAVNLVKKLREKAKQEAEKE
jgi:hypothetical protein